MDFNRWASTTIIIPSKKSPVVDRVVGTVTAQKGYRDQDQILVIGNDDTDQLTSKKAAQLIDTGHTVDASTARNIGIEAAQGNLLIFLDGDCLTQAGWLAEHRAAHVAGNEVVGGGVLPQGDNYWHLTYNLTKIAWCWGASRS